jgi:hypothetical protein
MDTKVAYANEELYKIYVEIAGLLWAAMIFTVFYVKADLHVRLAFATLFLLGVGVVLTGLLIKKQRLKASRW